MPERRSPTGSLAVWPVDEWAGDARWPACCTRCGYTFADEDEWQVSQEAIYAAADGREWSQRDLPAGALYDAAWLPDGYMGPDGIHLAVVLPTRNSPWFADGPATGGGRWTRTGDPRHPENLSISPSIAAGHADQPGYYHSWLGASGVPPGHLGDP